MKIIGFIVVVCFCLQVVHCLTFLAIGDWGGQETAPFYTEGQLASVQGMEKIAQSLKSQFVLGVGEESSQKAISNYCANNMDYRR